MKSARDTLEQSLELLKNNDEISKNKNDPHRNKEDDVDIDVKGQSL
jgi:hypothetical protein